MKYLFQLFITGCCLAALHFGYKYFIKLIQIFDFSDVIGFTTYKILIVLPSLFIIGYLIQSINQVYSILAFGILLIIGYLVPKIFMEIKDYNVIMFVVESKGAEAVELIKSIFLQKAISLAALTAGLIVGIWKPLNLKVTKLTYS
ncbi:hypothetical protein OO013_07320 [Mangrovivirga sp. M17]|uniref:Uncharacterized protein n=1 Tax=Mangrovivirga halotolerans TaxID=2993936 RepID=A0ABT3RQQ0_9BACT|nr:hypothetical protein [Mangrovivirga halotolerans]MCX2743668.1 hypothetical protein [Mangrovivirga halotolerans]